MSEELDKVLEIVGSGGRFQKYLILLLFFPVNFFAGFMTYHILFQVVVPDHWCHVPTPANTSLTPANTSLTPANTSLTPAQWRNLTIPRTEDGKYSNCFMYEVDEQQGEGNTFFVTNITTPCRFGWDYDSTQFQATVATSFGWFCDRAAYSQHILAVTMAGNGAGCLLLPILSDKYLGRRAMIPVTSGIYVVFTVPCLFISQPIIHLVFRFLSAIVYPVCISIPLILVVEVVKCEWRSIVTAGCYLYYTLGIVCTSLVAYLLPHWKTLALLSFLPHAISPIYWWFVPESPRWLLSKGRLKECCHVLQRISVINGRGEVPRGELEEKLLLLSTKQDKAVHLHEVFRYPVLRLRIIKIFIIGVGMYVSYGVLMMGIDIMPSNYSLGLFIVSLLHLPGDCFGWVISEYLGRRFTLISTIVLASVMSIVATFCLHNELLMAVVTGVVKLAVVVCLQGMYLVVPELLPTPIRTSAFGLYLSLSFSSMTVTPYLISPDLDVKLRYWAMLGCLLTSLMGVLTLPETLALPLPQNFLEAEQLGRGRPLTTWIHHWNHHKYHHTATPATPTTSPPWPGDPERQAEEPLKPPPSDEVA